MSQTPQAELDSRRAGRLRRLLGRAALVLLGMILAELALRLVLSAAGRGYDGAASAARARQLVEASGEPLAPSESGKLGSAGPPPGETGHSFAHPYTGYETSDGFRELESELAFLRSGRWSALQSAHPFIVLVLGGSVAHIFASSGEGGAARLEEVLRADQRLAGRDVLVLNHGRSAFKQPQQVMLLAYLFALGLTPDAVINLDGFNEVAFGLLNTDYGVHPLFPSHHHAGRLLAGRGADKEARALAAREWQLAEQLRGLAGLALRAGFFRSAILGTLTEARLQSLQVRWSDARGDYLAHVESEVGRAVTRGPAYDPEESAVLDLVVADWVSSSVSLHGLCAARSVTYLHVLQPTLLDEGSKPLTAEESGRVDPDAPEMRSAIRGVRAGYPRLRQASEQLRAAGVAFLDASQLFVDVRESLYYDHCHFGRAGNELLAEAIGRALLERLP